MELDGDDDGMEWELYVCCSVGSERLRDQRRVVCYRHHGTREQGTEVKQAPDIAHGHAFERYTTVGRKRRGGGCRRAKEQEQEQEQEQENEKE